MSVECFSATSYIPPDVCIETPAESVRSILETTRQDSRPLVKLCFLFVGIDVIEPDSLLHGPNQEFCPLHRNKELTASQEEVNRCAELNGENRMDDMLSKGGDESSVCSASFIESVSFCKRAEVGNTLHGDSLGS